MKMKSIVASLCVAGLLIGCTNKNSSKKTNTLGINSIKTSDLTPEGKAEQLARAAEELLGSNPAGFMYADSILDAALLFDSGNKRAQLLKATISPAMAYRGIWSRIEPLAKQDQEAYEKYQSETARGREEYPKSVVEFLSQGGSEIKNTADAQKFIDELSTSYEKIRVFFKQNRNLNITMYLPTTLSLEKMSEYKVCDVNELENGDIEYTPCSTAQKTTVNFNVADNMAVEQMAASVVVMHRIYNAYSFGDVKKAVDARKANPEVSNSEVYNILSQDKSFGTIRNPKALESVLGMGLDGVKAVRYALANQKDLCPFGSEYSTRTDHKYYVDENGFEASKEDYEDSQIWGYGSYYSEKAAHKKDQRPGMAFKNGICQNETNSDGELVSDILASTEKTLLGEVLTVNRKNDLGEVVGQVNVRPAAFFKGAIADVKALKPEFNECDKVAKVNDKTLRGIFVDGDFNDLLSESSACGDVQQQEVQQQEEQQQVEQESVEHVEVEQQSDSNNV